MLFHGRINNPNSFGTNSLIKEGARLITKPEEIIEEIYNNKI
jgi:predicted Rossmann fold nucleotide-binding protein DprA/Smf involved in DNA uptake